MIYHEYKIWTAPIGLGVLLYGCDYKIWIIIFI